jgi:hypothetical protein
VPKSYELSEVAREYLPGAPKDPERWLRRKLNARAFPGTRVGRHWVMTDHQIQVMLAVLGTEAEVVPTPEPEAVSFDGLSPRSRRRLKAVR